MEMTRRGFLKFAAASMGTAAAASAGTAGPLSGSASAKAAAAPPLRTKTGREIPTICAFCSVGCGLLATVEDGQLIELSGDPNHPINQGALCAKGSALYNVRNVYEQRPATPGATTEPVLNPRRLTKVLYRAPGGNQWEERNWDWALAEIAKRVARTRDDSFLETDYDGITVNRTTGIGVLGGAALDNEECYLVAKLSRALGVVYLEHQARL